MSNKIEIRGVIVPSDYDVDFMFSYIKRGIITPESRVRKLISEADTKKDIDLYINSPGGSVFAGNEMINALQDWKNESGKNVNITVGAMAASMGSAILVTLGANATVKMHTNSKIMFHGAWGGAIGGSEAMKDYSELLGKINADIKVKLIRNYKLEADVVNEWFKEGREGWLTAEEAKAVGMADEIIGEDAEMPESVDGLGGMMNENGMKIAALILNKQQGDDTMKELMKKLVAYFGLTEDAKDEEVMAKIEEGIKAEEEAEEVTVEETETTEETEETSEETEEETEEVSQDVKDLLDKAGTLQETIDNLNTALNKKQSDNDKMKADFDKLQIKHEKLVGSGIRFEAEENAPTDWKSCLDKCDGDYVRARKEHPEVYSKLMGR